MTLVLGPTVGNNEDMGARVMAYDEFWLRPGNTADLGAPNIIHPQKDVAARVTGAYPMAPGTWTFTASALPSSAFS